MKKSEIKSAVDALATTAEVIAYASANGLNVTIDANATVNDARNACVAVGDEDAPTFDFAAMMSQFDAEAALAETNEQRTKRIISEVINETWTNGVKPNRLITGCRCNGAITWEKKNGYVTYNIPTEKPVPTMGTDAQGKDAIVPIRSISVSMISVQAALKLAGYGNVCQYINVHPDSVINILADCTFDTLAKFFMQFEIIKNPFSTTNNGVPAKKNFMDHYMVNLVLGPRGVDEIKEIANVQRLAVG